MSDDRVVAIMSSSKERCDEIARLGGFDRYLSIYDITSALLFEGHEYTIVDLSCLDQINIADRFLMHQYFNYVQRNPMNGFGKRMFNPDQADEFVLALDEWVAAAGPPPPPPPPPPDSAPPPLDSEQL